MTENRLENCLALGEDAGRGNLLGIQACLHASDFFNEPAYHRALRGYLADARARGWLNPLTIAVYPEYIGTWLALAGEESALRKAKTLRQAMQALILAHPASFAWQLLKAREKGKVEASLFRLKAPLMAGIYSRTFSSLAKEFGVTIVAGSILLPEPQIRGNLVFLSRQNAPLQNVSAVFRPDGSAYPNLVRKCFPTQDELPFTAPGKVEDLPAFETPAGRLGVLICADSWFPAAYERMRTLKVNLLAVPSYISHAGAWKTPWAGYSGWTEPPDVDRSDIQRLEEGQAWHKYALAGRMASSPAQAGVNVFLQGALWDMASDGYSLVLQGSKLAEIPPQSGGLVNLWL